MKTNWILVLLSVVLISSCNEETTHDTHEEIIHEINNEPENAISKEVEAILKSIPNPKEITATIKASGADYSSLAINNPYNAEKYSTNHRKAINLGVYGTDLGYMGIYDQSSLIPEHLKVINKLATDIDLAHLLRTEKLKELISEGDVTDSVFNISALIFDDMCKYLQTNERHESSVLMLLGGWLEAIHIATSVAYNAKIENPNLSNKIAEQKVVLNQFIEVVELYKDKPLFKQLLIELTKLKKIYNEVQYNDNTETVKDTSIVTIPVGLYSMTEIQLAQLSIQLNKIRKSVIAPM